MDSSVLNNYRPVSNIIFVFKGIEKAVDFHLNK